MKKKTKAVASIILAGTMFLTGLNFNHIKEKVNEIVNGKPEYDNNVSEDELDDDVTSLVPKYEENIDTSKDVKNEVLNTDLNKVNKSLDQIYCEFPLENKTANQILTYISIKEYSKPETPKTLGETVGSICGYNSNYATDNAISKYMKETMDLVLESTKGDVDSDNIYVCGGVLGKILDPNDGIIEAHSKNYKKCLERLNQMADFIFYDEKIDGCSFNNISYYNKIMINRVCLFTYYKMDSKWSYFDTELDQFSIMPSLPARIIVFDKYLQALEDIDDDCRLIREYLGSTSENAKIMVKEITR